MNFFAGVFSDGGNPSSSRVFSGVALVAVIIWGSFVVCKTHDLPDPIKLGAATAFTVAHYGINRFSQGKGSGEAAAPPQ